MTGTFDRIVSVGMFEHVGVPHYREFFDKIRDSLAEDGVALIHTIGQTTAQMSRASPCPRSSTSWPAKGPGRQKQPRLSNSISKTTER